MYTFYNISFEVAPLIIFYLDVDIAVFACVIWLPPTVEVCNTLLLLLDTCCSCLNPILLIVGVWAIEGVVIVGWMIPDVVVNLAIADIWAMVDAWVIADALAMVSDWVIDAWVMADDMLSWWATVDVDGGVLVVKVTGGFVVVVARRDLAGVFSGIPWDNLYFLISTS